MPARVVVALKPLPDIAGWALGNGLEIVLMVTGAILLTRGATWLGGRIIERIDANAREADALVRSEAAKHRHALAQVVTWTTLVLIYCVTAVLIVQRLGVSQTTLVAPAAVAGVAVGFGAQRVVQDILAGTWPASTQFGNGRSFSYWRFFRRPIRSHAVPIAASGAEHPLRTRPRTSPPRAGASPSSRQQARSPVRTCGLSPACRRDHGVARVLTRTTQLRRVTNQGWGSRFCL